MSESAPQPKPTEEDYTGVAQFAPEGMSPEDMLKGARLFAELRESDQPSSSEAQE